MMARPRLFVGTALAVSMLASSSAATTIVPYPPKCSVEPVLVGDSNGMLVGDGFRVAIRDLNGLPIVGSAVRLNFAGTTRPYTSQVAPAQAICPSIVGITDVAGNVVFQARFGGYANAPAIQVVADGVSLRSVLARSTDLDANGATGILDFNLFRANFLHVPASQETDYDETGSTDIGDFNIFRKVYLNDIPGTPCP